MLGRHLIYRWQSSKQFYNHGLLPCLQENFRQNLHQMIPSHLTDSGTTALAHVLSAADPTNWPTLEHLHLDEHRGVSSATAVALAAAPLHSLSKLSMTYGGAQEGPAV